MIDARMPGRNHPGLAVLAILWAACNDCTCTSGPPIAGQAGEGPYPVVHVVDGDTIHVRVRSAVRKIRFVCIDTPEVSGPRRTPLGDQATAALARLIGASDVYIQRDDTHEDMDRHGRLLRHVFLEQGTHLNVEMVAGGWSAYYTKYGHCHRYRAAFEKAQDEASRAGFGIWAHPSFLHGGYLDNSRGNRDR